MLAFQVAFYALELAGLGAVAAMACGMRLSARTCWVIAGTSLTVAVLRPALLPPEGWDFHVFWSAGRTIWQGQDPYLTSGQRLLLANPPTALPIFALFALLPEAAARIAWAYVNLALAVGLVAATARLVAPRLPAAAVALLAAVLVLSPACRFGGDAGQLAVLGSAASVLALWADGSGRPIGAGAALALATVKTATMLPFLLLIWRKSCWKTLLACAGISAALCVAATRPGELLGRGRHCLTNIAAMSKEGGPNDVAFGNPASVDIVALDHLFYRLGLR